MKNSIEGEVSNLVDISKNKRQIVFISEIVKKIMAKLIFPRQITTEIDVYITSQIFKNLACIDLEIEPFLLF